MDSCLNTSIAHLHALAPQPCDAIPSPSSSPASRLHPSRSISPEWIERKGMEERVQCKQSIREFVQVHDKCKQMAHATSYKSTQQPKCTRHNHQTQYTTTDHQHSSATPSRWKKKHKRRHFVTLSDPNSDGQWTDTSQSSIGNGKDHTGASTEWHQQVITRSLRRQALSPSSRVGARQDLQKILADACVQKMQTSVHRGEGPP